MISWTVFSQPLNDYSNFIHHISLTNENYQQIFVQKLWNPITTLMHYIPHEMAKIEYVQTTWKHTSKLRTAEPKTKYVRNSKVSNF
jgi:hypothetical protein